MIMKRLGLIILLALAIPFVGWSQTSHQAVINSMGGGTSSGGVYTNFGVVGQIAQDSSRTDGNGTIWRSVGFMHAADNNVVVPVCDIPLGLEILELQETSASFAWQAEAGQSYDYRITVDGQNDWTETINQNVNTIEITGLDAGTSYEFQVRTNCGGELVSEWTESLLFTTFQFDPCDPVTNITSTVEGTSATINWTLPENAFSSLAIRARQDGDTEWPVALTQSLGTDIQSFEYTDLSPGIYQVQISTSCTGYVDPVYSSTILFEIDNPCQAPALAFGDIDDSSVNASWEDVGASAYNLRIRRKGTFDWTDPVQVTNGLTYTFEGLADGVKYEIQIQSDCGASSISEYGAIVEAETEGTPCVVPTGLSVSNVGQTTADLSWETTNALFYEIRYRKVNTAAWQPEDLSTSNASISIEGLTPGTNYEFQVNSICENNTPGSGFSVLSNFETAAPDTPCLVPVLSSPVVKTGEDIGDVEISWTDESAVAYEFRFRERTSFIWITRSVQEQLILLEGLAEGATYEYQVRSLCGTTGDITSAWTSAQEFMIPSTIVCEAPTNVTATSGASDGEILVSFSGVTNASQYTIKYRITGLSSWGTVNLTEGGSIFVPEPGISYDLRVATVCSANGTELSDYSSTITVVSGAVTPVVCDLPSNLTVQPGIGSVTIGWTAGSDDYNFRYRLKGTAAWQFLELNSSQFSSTTLQQGMTYQYQVRSDCSDFVKSDWTAIGEFTTEGLPACDVPQFENTPLVGTEDITIAWGAGTGAVYYNLQYRAAGTVLWSTISTTNTTATVSNLQTGTNYQFRIQSVCDENGDLTSAYSLVSTFSTEGLAFCTSPAAPAVSFDGNSTRVSWTAVAEADKYQLRYRLLGTSIWSLINSVGVNNFVDIVGLPSGVTYQYQVRTVCDEVNQVISPYGDIATFETPGDPCLAPLPIADVTGNSATVSWTPATGSAIAEKYTYEYRILGAITWQQGETTSLSVVLNDLAPGETYQFRIKSICDESNNIGSPMSNIISFAIPGVSTCTIPVGLQTNSTQSSSANVNWTSNGSATYDVQYRPVGSQVWVTKLNVNTNQLTISGLNSNTAYEWRVRSDCNTGASSDFSALATFTTSVAPGLVASQSIQTDLNESDLERGSNESADETDAENVQSINIQSIALMNIDVYPNPFRDNFNLVINNPNDANATITLFNLAGLRIMDIFEGGLSAGQSYGFKIDGSTLTDGIYMIVINGVGDQRIVKRVMLKR